jgi:G3E family GTPase
MAWLKVEAVLGSSPHDHTYVDRNRHGDDICSHVIVVNEPVSPLLFHFFLDALKMSAGPSLLRAKGLFALADDPDRPVVVHGVQHLVHTIDKLDRWPSDDKRTRLVLIGRDLNVEAMRNILASQGLFKWLQYLTQSQGAHILRLKGILDIKGEEQRCVVQGVMLLAGIALVGIAAAMAFAPGPRSPF